MTAVFAHRGFTDGFTENTLEAFVEARRHGADGVELDVRRSADGALVVHHDAEIPGVGRISELDARDLPAHVPLLASALDVCDGMLVNVEIKNSPGDPGYEPDHGIAGAVAGAVADAGWTERVVVSSFDRDTAVAALAADPRLTVGWLLGGAVDPASVVGEAADAGFKAIHPHVVRVDAGVVAAAHGAGLAVNTWTVNERADLRRMVELGVDVIITDRLAEALVAAGAGPGG